VGNGWRSKVRLPTLRPGLDSACTSPTCPRQTEESSIGWSKPAPTKQTKNKLMKTLLTLAFLVFVPSLMSAPRTMRVDYYHTGNNKQELFSIDRIVIEPLPWPGDLSQTSDTTNLGKYFFEVRDRDNKRVLYSRG